MRENNHPTYKEAREKEKHRSGKILQNKKIQMNTNISVLTIYII